MRIKTFIALNLTYRHNLSSQSIHHHKVKTTLLSFKILSKSAEEEDQRNKNYKMDSIQQAEIDLEAAKQALNNAKAQAFLQTFSFPIEQTKQNVYGPLPMEVDRSHEEIANLARDFDQKLDVVDRKYEMLKKRVLNLERNTETDTHYTDLRELCTSENPRKTETFGKSIIFGKGRNVQDRRAPLQQRLGDGDRCEDRRGEKDRYERQMNYDRRRDYGYDRDGRRGYKYGKKY